MTLVVNELRSNNTTTASRQSGAATRSFTVFEDSGAGVSRSSTYGLAGIPQANDPHPDNGATGLPNLYADSFGRVTYGRGILVTVGYNERPPTSATFPIDPLANGFLTVGRSFRIERVEMPVFAVAKIAVGEGAEAVEKFVWQRLEGDFSFDKAVHTHTARLNGELGTGLTLAQFMAAADAIDAQANKIHTFNDKKYRFLPQDISQETINSGTTPAKYDINYTWEYDPGVPNTLVGRAGYAFNAGSRLVFYAQPVGTPPVPLFTHAYPQQDAEFVIRPFTTLRTFANPVDLTVPPIMDFAPAYPEDPNGWQSLPGFS